MVLGIASWWGLDQWNQQQKEQSEQNSILYLQVQELAQASSLTEEQRTALRDKSESLKKQAEGTQYGWYSALMLAKLAFEQNDHATAASELQYVLDGSGDQALKNIAQLRLARVEAARGDIVRALELLQSANAGDLSATYAELRGDLHMQQGDTEAARIAYQEAINNASDADRTATDLLALKLNRATPAATPADLETAPEAEAQSESATENTEAEAE